MHKLDICGQHGESLQTLKDFLSEMRQRVVLNGQCSKWDEISVGVPQGSVLGPLFSQFILMVSLTMQHVT